jgi:hypothetical protein
MMTLTRGAGTLLALVAVCSSVIDWLVLGAAATAAI